MSFLSFLGKLFGNKSEKDLKEIQPILDNILAEEPALKDLSNDELRDKINKIRLNIKESVAENENKIAQLKEQIEATAIEKRQPL